MPLIFSTNDIIINVPIVIHDQDNKCIQVLIGHVAANLSCLAQCNFICEHCIGFIVVLLVGEFHGEQK